MTRIFGMTHFVRLLLKIKIKLRDREKARKRKIGRVRQSL